MRSVFGDNTRLIGKLRVRLSTLAPNDPVNVKLPLQGAGVCTFGAVVPQILFFKPSWVFYLPLSSPCVSSVASSIAHPSFLFCAGPPAHSLSDNLVLCAFNQCLSSAPNQDVCMDAWFPLAPLSPRDPSLFEQPPLPPSPSPKQPTPGRQHQSAGWPPLRHHSRLFSSDPRPLYRFLAAQLHPSPHPPPP